MLARRKLVPLCVVVVLAVLNLPTMAQTMPEAAVVQQSAPSQQAGTNAAAALGQAAGAQSQPAGGSQAQQAPAQVSEPGPRQPEFQTSAPLRVMVGKSLLITTNDRLRRVSVTDPTIADAM